MCEVSYKNTFKGNRIRVKLQSDSRDSNQFFRGFLIKATTTLEASSPRSNNSFYMKQNIGESLQSLSLNFRMPRDKLNVYIKV